MSYPYRTTMAFLCSFVLVLITAHPFLETTSANEAERLGLYDVSISYRLFPQTDVIRLTANTTAEGTFCWRYQYPGEPVREHGCFTGPVTGHTRLLKMSATQEYVQVWVDDSQGNRSSRILTIYTMP